MYYEINLFRGRKVPPRSLPRIFAPRGVTRQLWKGRRGSLQQNMDDIRRKGRCF